MQIVYVIKDKKNNWYWMPQELFEEFESAENKERFLKYKTEIWVLPPSYFLGKNVELIFK